MSRNHNKKDKWIIKDSEGRIYEKIRVKSTANSIIFRLKKIYLRDDFEVVENIKN